MNNSIATTNQDRPLITFALFAYNQENHIEEAVQGAFSQTYSQLEIVLSDDCSTDRTFEIMERMANAYQGPHKIVLNRVGREHRFVQKLRKISGISFVLPNS